MFNKEDEYIRLCEREAKLLMRRAVALGLWKRRFLARGQMEKAQSVSATLQKMRRTAEEFVMLIDREME